VVVEGDVPVAAGVGQADELAGGLVREHVGVHAEHLPQHLRREHVGWRAVAPGT